MFSTLRHIYRHPVSSRHPIAAVARYVRWQIGSRILSMPVVFDWIGDARMIISPGMTGASGNPYCGLHEFDDMAFLCHMIQPGERFVDVGANIGSYTLLAACWGKADVIAFEPHPKTCGFLQANVNASGVASQVRVVSAAVGDKSEVLRFTADRDTMNHVVDVSYEGQVIEVPVVRLDESLGNFGAVFWKFDVEGYEEKAIQGALDQIDSPVLKAIMVETASRKADQLLLERGFQRYSYDPFRRLLKEFDGSRSSSNCLWIRGISEMRDRVASARKVEVFGVEF